MSVDEFLTQELIDKLQSDIDDNNGVIDYFDLEPILTDFKNKLLNQ